MTAREIEVMRGKNVIFVFLLTGIIAPFVGQCPPWGTNLQALVMMPLLIAFFQFCAVLFLYHAKGEFGLPPQIGWAVFLSPLSMCPALWLWPADNEVAACCFMASNVIVTFALLWKGQVDLSAAAASPSQVVAAPLLPAVLAQDNEGDVPEAIRRVQEIMNMQDASPEVRLNEMAALTTELADRLDKVGIVP